MLISREFSLFLLLVLILSIIAAFFYSLVLLLDKNELLTESNKTENKNINVLFPKPGQRVKSPLLVKGQAKGTWFFEASFPIKILDQTGKVLAVSQAQATKDWMTEEFVPFRGEIVFDSEKTISGFLVLAKDNPSGLPENDEEIILPIILEPAEINDQF